MIKKRFFATSYVALFSIMFGYGVVVPFIDYFATKFGVSLFLSGFIISFYALGQLLFSPVAGELLLIFNKRVILFFSLLMYGFASVYTFFAPSFLVLLLCRFVCGVFASFIFPSAETYVTSCVSDVDPRYVTRMSILLSTACGIGMGVSPFVGVYFLSSSGVYFVGILVFVICFVTAFLSRFVLENNLGGRSLVGFEFFGFIRGVFVQIFRLYCYRPARLVLNSFLFYGLITSSMEAFIFKYVSDVGVFTAEIPYLLIGFTVLCCVGYLVLCSAWVEQKVSYYNTLLLYAGVSGFCFVMIFFSVSVVAFLFLIIVAFFSLALYSSVCVSFVTNEFEYPERILAIKNALICIGMVLGPVIGGILYQLDPELVFLFLGLVLIFNMVYGLFRK